MSDMVEKVARALCKVCGRDPDAILNEVPEWVYRQSEARAAIAAMPDTQLLQTMASALEDLAHAAGIDAEGESGVSDPTLAMLAKARAALAQYRERTDG